MRRKTFTVVVIAIFALLSAVLTRGTIEGKTRSSNTVNESYLENKTIVRSTPEIILLHPQQPSKLANQSGAQAKQAVINLPRDGFNGFNDFTGKSPDTVKGFKLNLVNIKTKNWSGYVWNAPAGKPFQLQDANTLVVIVSGAESFKSPAPRLMKWFIMNEGKTSDEALNCTKEEQRSQDPEWVLPLDETFEYKFPKNTFIKIGIVLFKDATYGKVTIEAHLEKK